MTIDLTDQEKPIHPLGDGTQCWICGAMDHEFIMFGSQKVYVCPQCPEPMIYISIPRDYAD